jgi:hypothetical protein
MDRTAMEAESEQSGQTGENGWYAHFPETAEGAVSTTRLGAHHAAFFQEGAPTLLVGFENAATARTRPEKLPLPLSLAEEAGWSYLTLVSNGDTWFRDPEIFAYFDRLTDDGFFDGFDRVVFFGTGPCGYAAAAYSVAAPGATVIAIAPQATLEPRTAGWDRRFPDQRRADFSSRYAFAPDMLDAAERAYILFDPDCDLDAKHAAMFRKANVSRLRCPWLGPEIEADLLRMGVLSELIDAACEGKLNDHVFHRLYRARRDYAPYLRRLLERLEAAERDLLMVYLCRNVTERMRAPRFRRRLKDLGVNEATPNGAYWEDGNGGELPLRALLPPRQS